MVYKPTLKPKCSVDSVPVCGSNSGVGPALVSSEGDPLL